MPQTGGEQMIRIGVDVGGTFTDLVAWDGEELHIIKVPSTPPRFELAVIDTVARVSQADRPAEVVHGSTVATNALLQRAGAPIAFVTTAGFRDMLLIGRQNRPKLYDLHVRRPPPITSSENWFTVPERIDSEGRIVVELNDAAINRLIEQIRARGLAHVAVCLLFSFVNPVHEQMIARRCTDAGMTVSVSSEVLPEFREYERASTTAINASLRPVVAEYLARLDLGLREGEAPAERELSQPSSSAGASPSQAIRLRIMHGAGGTMSAEGASRNAARLVLSGPAGGVIGAAYVARLAGFANCITYDMGGTSTDVAVILDGRAQWTTSTTIDGLPVALPMFDINTVGAGGGSIAFIDAGGALRVGPRSAGATPGPACYGRGGDEPTVTDANLILGRIVPERFLSGTMRLDPDAAMRAITKLGETIGKDPIATALGIVTVAQSNMSQAIRAVTSQRGHDPRQFALVSFGGAGGLHACALAESLDISTVVVPPHCGVLSALGMIVAPAVVDVSKTVVQRNRSLDDTAIEEEIAHLRVRACAQLEVEAEVVEFFADVRFEGQSHELKVGFDEPSRDVIGRRFKAAYMELYGRIPEARVPEIVTLRVRARGPMPQIALPGLRASPAGREMRVLLVDSSKTEGAAAALDRTALLARGEQRGPLLLLDDEATTYVPSSWLATAREDGIVLLGRCR